MSANDFSSQIEINMNYFLRFLMSAILLAFIACSKEEGTSKEEGSSNSNGSKFVGNWIGKEICSTFERDSISFTINYNSTKDWYSISGGAYWVNGGAQILYLIDGKLTDDDRATFDYSDITVTFVDAEHIKINYKEENGGGNQVCNYDLTKK